MGNCFSCKPKRNKDKHNGDSNNTIIDDNNIDNDDNNIDNDNNDNNNINNDSKRSIEKGKDIYSNNDVSTRTNSTSSSSSYSYSYTLSNYNRIDCNLLLSSTMENTKPFCIKNYVTKGRIIDVYDGDTFKIAVFINVSDICTSDKIDVINSNTDCSDSSDSDSSDSKYDNTKINTINGKNKHQYVIRWINCRLKGIDTPEIRTKNMAEKACGIEAKNYLEDLTKDKILDVTILKPGKYGGRYICEVFIDGVSLAQKMIDEKYGIPYDGGKKKPFDEWQL